MVDGATLTLGGGGQKHFLNDLGERGGGAFDCTREWITAKRAEAHRAQFRGFARFERKAIVIDHQDEAVARYGRARRREIKRDDLDAFEVDILPDV